MKMYPNKTNIQVGHLIDNARFLLGFLPDFKRILKCFEENIDLSKGHNLPMCILMSHLRLAELHIFMRKSKKAKTHLQNAIQLMQDLEMPDQLTAAEKMPITIN